MARVHWNPEWIGILGHLREMVSLSPESLASCWTKNHQHGPPATLDDKGDQPGTEDLLLMRAVEGSLGLGLFDTRCNPLQKKWLRDH